MRKRTAKKTKPKRTIKKFTKADRHRGTAGKIAKVFNYPLIFTTGIGTTLTAHHLKQGNPTAAIASAGATIASGAAVAIAQKAMHSRAKLVAKAIGRPALARRLSESIEDPYSKTSYWLAAQFEKIPKDKRMETEKRIRGTTPEQIWDSMLREMSRLKGKEYVSMYESIAKTMLKTGFTPHMLIQYYPELLKWATNPGNRTMEKFEMPTQEMKIRIIVEKKHGKWKARKEKIR